MKEALLLAARGRGAVEPNPMVGCAIVLNGDIIGRGYHRRFGGNHAEVEAIRNCGRIPPRGGTMYVTLEPCRHFGKTPPCVNAILEAGIRRVVVGALDPVPALSGGGAQILRDAGVQVDVGVLEDDALELMAPFFTRVVLKRPYVIAKWAQSLDGRLATAAGDSKWISSEASRAEAHELRGRVDAIVVGSQTVLTDDPLLTARGAKARRTARRAVLDGRLRIPETSRLVGSALDAPVVVFTGESAAAGGKAQRLAAAGVEVVGLPADDRGRPDLSAALGWLHAHDATNVMVEGGGALLTSFFKAGLVDEALVFIAPLMLGDGGPSPLTGFAPQRVADGLRAHRSECRGWMGDVSYRLRLTTVPRP